MLVNFIDVGRDKKSWTADIPLFDGELDSLAMVRSIKKHKALGSRGIDLTDDGLILVGGFRAVGRWECSPDATRSDP